MPPNIHELVPTASQPDIVAALETQIILLVIESRKRFYLVSIQVTNLESGEVVVKRIRAKRDEVIDQTCLSQKIQGLFWKTVIDTATVATASNPSPLRAVTGRLLSNRST